MVKQDYALTPCTPGQAFELIFTALGEASMCWMSEEDYAPQAPPGVFDSSRAGAIGQTLYASLVAAGILRQQVPLDQVAKDLIDALQSLFDTYGPTGVADVAIELADAWRETARQSRASNDRYVEALERQDAEKVEEEFPDLKEASREQLVVEVVQLRQLVNVMRDAQENPEMPDRDPSDFEG